MALKLLTKKDKLGSDPSLWKLVDCNLNSNLAIKAKYKQSREKSFTERWYACEGNPLVTNRGSPQKESNMNTILAVTYAFMLGFMPCDWSGTPDNCITHKNATHVKYEIGLDLFNCVHLYTGEDTKQTPVTLFNWYPYTQKYYLGAEYHKTFNEAFTLKAGVRHECNHPVSCWGTQPDKYNDSATEFYIGFYGKVDIWRKK